MRGLPSDAPDAGVEGGDRPNLLTLWDSRGRTLDEWMELLKRWTAYGSLKPLMAEAFPL